jgi:hypothetical protein
MSVIFKTLKKLKTESADKENSKKKLMHRKRIYIFQNALNSPSYILLLLFILTVIGAGTLYGYYQLRETEGGNTKDVAVSKTDIRQPIGVDISESSKTKGTTNPSMEENPNSGRIEYLPPQLNDNKVDVYASNKPEKNKIPLVTDKKRSPKARETIEKNTAVKVKTEKPDKPEAKEVLPVPEVEKIFVANAKKNAKIASLVSDIRWEMEHGNDPKIEKLLNELATLKGRDNSYFLKLKAVWYIHNKEFERAKDLLKIVLTKNEHDQEAGINMAIIEINAKHIQKAYQRLIKLRAIYPENIRIAEILQNMKPLLN